MDQLFKIQSASYTFFFVHLFREIRKEKRKKEKKNLKSNFAHCRFETRMMLKSV